MDFTELVDLASERLGGRVLAANDDFFAPKENLLKPAAPIFVAEKYTDRGKWMDGWETRRRRTPGYDWCVVKLGLPGRIRGVVVDTSFFKGNFPARASLEACVATGTPSLELLLAAAHPWTEILSESTLIGDSQNRFHITSAQRFTHLRLKIFPDGGVARLRVHGEVLPDWEKIEHAGEEVDLAAVEHGGVIVASSDMFFGSPANLILPGPALGMFDGWETRRRRGPGHDWAVVRLGASGTIHRVVVETSFFKGNFPESCSLDASRAASGDATHANLDWTEVLARTPLEADARRVFEKELRSSGEATHVRLNIYPDGGVARLRVFGQRTQHAR
ncbi:MAG: allantoicase [Candidatus Acidiferrales bacterium]